MVVESDLRYHIMIGEVAVRNRDESGCFNSAYQIGGAIRKIQVIQPDIWATKDADCASIRPQPMAIVRRRVSHHGRPCGHEVEDSHTMDDDVGDTLDGYPRSPCNLYIKPSSVNRLVAVHDQLLRELDSCVLWEDDPERLCLNDSPP